MSKLLQSRLPVSLDTESVDSTTYNRLVRILELNLLEFDPDNTRQITQEERNILKFNLGSIIYNTSIGALQVFDGSVWQNISTPTNPHGFEATSSVGVVSVSTEGDITLIL